MAINKDTKEDYKGSVDEKGLPHGKRVNTNLSPSLTNLAKVMLISSFLLNVSNIIVRLFIYFTNTTLKI